MSSLLQIILRSTGQTVRNGKHKLTSTCHPINLSRNQSTRETNQQIHEDTSPNEDEKQYVNDIKNKILAASMEFVKENGWTKETMGKGAMSVGYASTVHSIFPHGSAHLVHYFTVNCNNQLAENMAKEANQSPNGLVTNPVKFIEDSIISRIEMLEPYKSSWNNALATIINSRMALDQAASLMTLADDICYFAGDRSVDSVWYARRAVVGAVYQASELHWLGGGKHTRDFTSSQLSLASNLEAVPKNISALLTIVQGRVRGLQKRDFQELGIKWVCDRVPSDTEHWHTCLSGKQCSWL